MATLNYTTTYLNKVLTVGYCCIGTLGDDVDLGLITGLDKHSSSIKLRKTFLYVTALYDWKQNADGSAISPNTNSITQQDMNNLVDCIIKNCVCVPDGIDNVTPVVIQEGYWESDYANDFVN